MSWAAVNPLKKIASDFIDHIGAKRYGPAASELEPRRKELNGMGGEMKNSKADNSTGKRPSPGSYLNS